MINTLTMVDWMLRVIFGGIAAIIVVTLVVVAVHSFVGLIKKLISR